VSFTSLRDYPVDTNNNALYNKLVIEVTVEVTQEGSYDFLCMLTVEASGNTVDIDTILLVPSPYLEEGENTVLMEFSSEAIFKSGMSGVYRADIEVQQFNHTTRWTITHLTNRFYDHRTFQAEENPPPVPPDAPRVELDLHYVNVSTDVFQVFVNRTMPEIIFRYRDGDPAMPDFLVTYYRLIMFQDDGDRYYNGEDPVASVLLTNYPWAFSNIEVSGPIVSFDLRARIPIPVGSGFVSTGITLTFTVTNGTVPDPINSGFIRGDASELKVDITFEPEGPIPDADHMAFEALVSDSLGTHDFLVEEPVGFKHYPRTDETSFTQVPILPLATHTTVGMVDENLVWHAYMGWQNLAQETWSTQEDTLLVDVGGSFRVRGGALELYMAYPYTEDLMVLDHDPSVGTVNENLPPEPLPPKPAEDPDPNPYVFWFAIIIGAVIILLTVYARAQGY
jgi:hypothetical protein